MTKVCVVTGSRADYGLLYWTISAISKSEKLELQLCVTGMHLSEEFGSTYKVIEEDGFVIDKKIDMLLPSDTGEAVSKSIGLGVIGFTDAFSDLKPDLILVLGDRFEIFSAAIAAMALNIPIAHCHGGEITRGLIDEAIRHSITKMSHLHFASTEIYRNRIIQLGESSERVWNVGALGVDYIKKTSLFSRKELEDDLGTLISGPIFLVTYHPVTLDIENEDANVTNLLSALDSFQNAKIIFTMSNADNYGQQIWSKVKEYQEGNKDRVSLFTSLGQKRYLSLLAHADLVIGNSSSGIIEAPSLKTPTVDIGIRQEGRVKANSVVSVGNDVTGIVSAINKALDPEFLNLAFLKPSPYEGGDASQAIVDILEEVELKNLKFKVFHDFGCL